MGLPFTVEQFYSVFRQYNETIWPGQILLFISALTAVILVFVPRRWSNVLLSSYLAFIWAWVALAYHLAFFASINQLAYVFSVLSLSGAIVFCLEGVIRRRLHFAWTGRGRGWVGLALIVFALVVYPMWSWYAGHGYPFMPTFGLPCPTTIFTIGLLSFLNRPHPRTPFIIPVLWCLMGAQAAFLLGVTQDMGLIVAGLIAIVLLVRAKHPAPAVRPKN